MKLAGITFHHTYTLGPVRDDGRVGYTVELNAPSNGGPGVYFVVEGENILYIGSYRTGVAKRWLYTRGKYLYHFKWPLVSEQLRTGAVLKVFAQDEQAIKEELNCAQNVWVNVAGIEARLIAMFHPPWNNQGKKSVVASIAPIPKKGIRMQQ